MHSRPMAIAEMRPDADAYFVTSIDSPKVAEIKANPECHPDLSKQELNMRRSAVSATIVRDQALIDRLYKEDWKIWFPKARPTPRFRC